MKLLANKVIEKVKQKYPQCNLVNFQSSSSKIANFNRNRNKKNHHRVNLQNSKILLTPAVVFSLLANPSVLLLLTGIPGLF